MCSLYGISVPDLSDKRKHVSRGRHRADEETLPGHASYSDSQSLERSSILARKIRDSESEAVGCRGPYRGVETATTNFAHSLIALTLKKVREAAQHVNPLVCAATATFCAQLRAHDFDH
jgi:hypothetical protein